MIDRDLAKAIDRVSREITEAEAEFNQATGLYVDAYTYKLKYLEALYGALMIDFKKSVEQDKIERQEAKLREECDSCDNTV